MKSPRTTKLDGFGTTIFAEMSALADKTKAINLGQGFPDTDGPQPVLDAAVAAIRAGDNQYPPGIGVADLRHAIREHQRRFYDIDLDPDREVLVTAGATEALAGALLGMLDVGDEVVVFEPMYDSYQACIALAGGVVRPVALRPSESGMYEYDPDELRAAFSGRTKLVLLNTPHNPTGKVFDVDELVEIANLAVEFDAYIVTDEVYEHLVFSGARHVPMATMPGVAERTLTISSAGKTFNVTGWKIGWATGPAPLVDAVKSAKQFLTFVNGAPFQPAIAVGLRLGDEVFDAMATELEAKRDLLAVGLRHAGFEVYLPQATYFLTADLGPLAPGVDGIEFCLALPELIGVVAVPTQVFYVHPDEGSHLIRFACCKRDEVLTQANERLARLPDRLPAHRFSRAGTTES